MFWGLNFYFLFLERRGICSTFFDNSVLASCSIPARSYSWHFLMLLETQGCSLCLKYLNQNVEATTQFFSAYFDGHWTKTEE